MDLFKIPALPPERRPGGRLAAKPLR